ncbi:EAL domain-containing protein [Pseudomonas sp. P7759]|uniref:EAL domain-containing protein n=1 Tax=Pseudomonas sp. P7759 TaxID=2738831 RepID=UPI0015A13B56|nr:EAL domain-containing protein [Pseudomonas sp. P7759]NWC77457.1 EAL domain-containing protein [Pseudomonas sp. P7759]
MGGTVTWLDSRLLLKQVIPLYQPIIELETSRVVAFEALARWLPLRGRPVSPEVFIPAARKAGVLDELTLVICQYVSRNITSLGVISINLELSQLGNMALLECIGELIGKESLKQLQVEVTEAGVADVDFARVREGMDYFKKQGVGFSLDDFGNGLSNLQRLCELPIDTLKIPSNLVVGMATQIKSFACVEVVMSLAEKLKLKTVAEGVENSYQCQVLKTMGCTMVQGNWCSKPLNAQRAADYIQVCSAEV